MKLYHRKAILSFGFLAVTSISLIVLLASSVLTLAAPPGTVGPQDRTHLTKGPVAWPVKKSQPLHQPINAPKSPKGRRLHQPTNPSKSGGYAVTASAVPSVCTPTTIDLKVLVLAADGNEADLPAIKQALDYLGTPYTVYIAAHQPNGLTPDFLSNGCHGYYQGIILTNGLLVYYNGSDYVGALSQDEWNTLWSYEATMSVRELSWYTFPTADFGFQAPSNAFDTSTAPVAMNLTSQGVPDFPYLNSTTTINIQYAWTYLAQPLTDGTTTPLLSDASGNALVAVYTTPDGRQVLSQTFDSNPYLIHDIVLSYGLVNWVTNGLFLGSRHVYMSAQVDDLFIDDSEWVPATPCGTNVDNTGSTYRITGSDLKAVVAWQKAKRAASVSANTTLSLAFNGSGTVAGAYMPDTLTPALTGGNQAQFNWINHTYDHTNLDTVDYATANSEIMRNNQAAKKLGLSHYSTLNMVTPDVSGLANQAFLKAAYDNGIRYLVTDTSVSGYNNPSPNAGISNPYQPAILMLPRHPNNLYYNVTTPNEWVAEYNCNYFSYWGRNLSYQEILDKESQVLVTYLLKGELDPWMFHQSNLRAYDGTHTLLGDLLDLTLQKYAQYYNLPILNQAMNVLGQTVASWMQYTGAGVTASIVPGVSITITAQTAARVPVTGLNAIGSEVYGGQHISYVNLAAGQTMTLPLT